ncbi:MAG: hypothetical protein MH252_07455 [Thermosynechococcaceae cyanobacterium MS004]|nr:hypothetical protein [Thermosynechococcaceae cyanobacterium MS004]
MTYWLQTLNGRDMSSDEEDYSIMHRLGDELDAACDELRIPRLSSFADFTDLELNMSDDEGEDEDTVDPETGCGYGIDDMQWFNISSGLSCLQSLRSYIASGWNPKLAVETRAALVEEMDDCILKLQAAAVTEKFHLAVIM